MEITPIGAAIVQASPSTSTPGTTASQAAAPTPVEQVLARIQPLLDSFGMGTINDVVVLAESDRFAKDAGIRCADIRKHVTRELSKLRAPHALSTTVAQPCNVISPSGIASAPPVSLGAPLTQMPAVMTVAEAGDHTTARLFKAIGSDGKPMIGRFNPDGSYAQLRQDELALFLAGHFVEVPDGQGGVRTIPLAVWWMNDPGKVVYDRILYDPENKLMIPGEVVLNKYHGLAVQAQKGGWKKIRRHLWKILCRCDRWAFKYLIKWLAHLVQYPGTNPEVMVVIRSNREGVGKSSLGHWMLRIFGPHGREIASMSHVFGQFNDALDSVSFVLLEEPIFPGDHQAAETMRAVLTAKTLRINPKGRAAYEVPHNIHFMMTTNGTWAIPAGADARRFLMLDADGQVMPRSYFNALWAEAEGGGIGAMLHDLLRVDLSRFNPRDVPKTDALRHQQTLSAPTMSRWALDAMAAGEMVPASVVTGVPAFVGFGSKLPTAALYGAYQAWATGMKQRPVSNVEFGRWLVRCGFARTMVRGVPHYDIPDAKAFGIAVMRQAGIT